MKEDLQARFDAKYEIAIGSECWLWTACTGTTGYGQIGVSAGRPARAHRVAWELHRGPIPEGLCVLHRCDVRHCVNPDHLFLGTQMDNIADREAKGRGQRGATNSRAQLTKDDIPVIRKALAAGEICRVVGARFGVTSSAISSVKHGRTWAWVPALAAVLLGCGVGLPSPYEQPPVGRALEAVAIVTDVWDNDAELPALGARCVDERGRLAVSSPAADTFLEVCGRCAAPPDGSRCADFYAAGECRWGCAASCFIYGRESWTQTVAAHRARTPVLVIAPRFHDDPAGAVAHETVHWLSACTGHVEERNARGGRAWPVYDSNHADPRLWGEGVLGRARGRL